MAGVQVANNPKLFLALDFTSNLPECVALEVHFTDVQNPNWLRQPIPIHIEYPPDRFYLCR